MVIAGLLAAGTLGLGLTEHVAPWWAFVWTLDTVATVGRSPRRTTPRARSSRSPRLQPYEVPRGYRINLDVRIEGRMTLIAPSGELDIASSPRLEDALVRASTSDAELVVIDLRAVEFMDACALRVLAKANRRAQRPAQRFALANPGRAAQRLLRLTGMYDTFTIVEAPETRLDRTADE